MFKLPKRDKILFNSISDFSFLSEIGIGGFSTVHEAKHKTNNNTYAIKIIDFNKISPADQENVHKEIVAHKTMGHKNINITIERYACYIRSNRARKTTFLDDDLNGFCTNLAQ